MKKYRRGNRLTKNQKKCQKVLKKEIEKVKQNAKSVSRGIPHKQVKIATAGLVELYKQPRFRDNHNFLLRRYSDLEKRNGIWYNIFIPFVVSVATTFILENKIGPFVGDNIIVLFQELGGIFPSILTMDTLISVIYWGCYALVVVLTGVFVWFVFASMRIIFKSFERSPAETIKENEMKIIKALLCKYKIFLPDQYVEAECEETTPK